ncbi:hypothetical protein CRE_17335 [Caenorhabditis remanei]|uniref:SCP domain-containing protein n=1 Tax=Caenorhabditis remanei TaxID=31234 RepID=E3MRZ3_CAERE|nr:hypothetical protein CRE_17335 [Caenorhabditis remanei]
MLKKMMFIVISIFLLESINAATPNSNNFDREQLNFINGLNIQRHNFANHTVNMQKLVWNKELQDIAEQHSLSALQSNGWRIVVATNYTNGAQNLYDIAIWFLKDSCPKNEEDRHLESKFFEHLNPLQTIIGCAKKTENELLKGYTVMCLLSPSVNLSLPSCAPFKSSCANGFEYKDGFCSNSDLPDSDQVMFISALNEKRRQIATEQHIANMYEMVSRKSTPGRLETLYIATMMVRNLIQIRKPQVVAKHCSCEM